MSEARLEEGPVEGGGEARVRGGRAALEQRGVRVGRDRRLLVVVGGGVEATRFHGGQKGRARRRAQLHCGSTVEVSTRGGGLFVCRFVVTG
jgi:hypothetical protein